MLRSTLAVTTGTLALALALAVSATAATVGGPSVRGKTHLGGKASELVHLQKSLGALSSGQFSILDDAGSPQPFTFPPKAVFVITDAIVQENGANGLVAGAIQCVATRIPYRFDTAQNLLQHVSLTAGVKCRTAPVLLTGLGPVDAHLYGYFVKDK